MKLPSIYPLSILSAGLVLSIAPARADDPANPPVPPDAPAAPATTPADGQAPTPPARHRHMHPGFVLGELTAKLGLTPDEQKSVGSIIANCDAQLKALRQDDSIAKEDKRAQMKTILDTTRGQIRAAITPSQQAIFDTLPTRGEKPQGAPPAPPAPAASAPNPST
jgi:hypothetical protein